MKIAKKSLSQNFINDNNICKKIISYCKIKDKDILEIGPGKGSLTKFIIEKNPKNLYLVEKDDDLSILLKNKYKKFSNVHVLNEDILDTNISKFRKVNIIGNLPYNISSKLILYLFKNSKHIDEMVLMIQKEMANKFDYKKNKLNKYKFFNKLYCKYEQCFDVPPSVFFPKPKVNSTVTKFVFNESINDWENMNSFSNKIFKSMRKKISNNLEINNKELDYIKNKRVNEINIEELLIIYNFF